MAQVLWNRFLANISLFPHLEFSKCHHCLLLDLRQARKRRDLFTWSSAAWLCSPVDWLDLKTGIKRSFSEMFLPAVGRKDVSGLFIVFDVNLVKLELFETLLCWCVNLKKILDRDFQHDKTLRNVFQKILLRKHDLGLTNRYYFHWGRDLPGGLLPDIAFIWTSAAPCEFSKELWTPCWLPGAF